MKMATTEDLLVIGVDVSKAKLDIVWGSDGSPETIGSSPESVGRTGGICGILRTDLSSSSITAGPPCLTPSLSPHIS